VLAEKLSVTRATISTWVKQLEQYGLVVNSVRGRGYRLVESLALLDRSKVIQSLGTGVAQQLKVIDIVAESESTNRNAMEAVYQSEDWKLFVSEYQHAGRGRRGKAWISPLGANLLFSLGHKAIWKPEVLYLASILTGLAIAAVIGEITSKPVKIKWPNDIYVEDRKLAGVLCELLGNPQDEALLVIGIGLNVLSSPEATDIASIKVDDLVNERPDRDKLLSQLVTSVIKAINAANEFGIKDIQQKYAAYDYLHKKSVKVIQGPNVYSGVAQGIDNSGQLLVAMDNDEIRAFNGGEVSVRW